MQIEFTLIYSQDVSYELQTNFFYNLVLGLLARTNS